MWCTSAAAGAWKGSSLTLDESLDLGVVPAVSRATASIKGTSASATQGIDNVKLDGSTLVVDATGTSPRLAWRVMSGGTQNDGTPSRLATFVDAKTGSVIRTEQEIVNVDGTGETLYGGTVPLQLTQSGSTYQLKDPTRGGTYTTDLNNKADSYLCQVFGSAARPEPCSRAPTTKFGNGTTSNRASAGADAQYGTNVTWDYYKAVHGRNGIFGTGKGSYNRVHYGQNYVNAFWDGTKMTYGDGDGTNYGPLTSLDVAGHEMSHGVTENTAGLTYSGESGGLNEATSDIFGTMVEFYASNANDPGDYLIGEEFDLKQHRRLPPDGQPLLGRQLAELLVRAPPAAPTSTTPRASATTSSTCSPRAPAPRRIGRRRTQLPDLQRLDGHRHRPGRRRQDLVPGADGLHDVQHQLHGRPDRHAERRQGPLRRGQHAIQHGRRRMERGRRVLTRPSPSGRSGVPRTRSPYWAYGLLVRPSQSTRPEPISGVPDESAGGTRGSEPQQGCGECRDEDHHDERRRSSSATTAAARPASRASMLSSGPSVRARPASVRRPAPPAATTGNRSAVRRRTGWASTRSGTDMPASLSR